jgi:hypothetical protein
MLRIRHTYAQAGAVALACGPGPDRMLLPDRYSLSRVVLCSDAVGSALRGCPGAAGLIKPGFAGVC